MALPSAAAAWRYSDHEIVLRQLAAAGFMRVIWTYAEALIEKNLQYRLK